MTVGAFRRDNNTNQPENPAFDDEAYTILKTADGCAHAYRVDIWTSPDPSAAQAVESIGPEIANATSVTGVTEAGGGIACEVWSSATLQRATGNRYAVALGTYSGAGDNALAEITLWNRPTCDLSGSAFGSSLTNAL